VLITWIPAQRLDRGGVPPEVVDQGDSGLPGQHSSQVHVIAVRRHRLQAAERLDGVRSVVGVREPDHDVLAKGTQGAAFPQHGVRRTSARRGA
jgi:hypothetical protein